MVRQVCSYPFDGLPDGQSDAVYSGSPDDPMFRAVCLRYADAASYMREVCACVRACACGRACKRAATMRSRPLQHATVAARDRCNARPLQRATVATRDRCNARPLQRATVATRDRCNTRPLQHATVATRDTQPLFSERGWPRGRHNEYRQGVS
jgi:hypothetical protein